MKTHFLTLAFLLSLMACSDTTKTDNKKPAITFEDREEAKKTAILSAERQDTIFLRYRFGMTQREAENHLQSLIDSGIVFTYIGYKHYFNYTGASEIETYKVYFSPTFNKGLLYELNTIWEHELAGFDASFHVMLIGNILKDKYPGEFFFYKDLYDHNRVVIYSKNLEISIYVSDSNEIKADFTDCHVQGIIDNRADSIAIEKHNKSKDYL